MLWRILGFFGIKRHDPANWGGKPDRLTQGSDESVRAFCRRLWMDLPPGQRNRIIHHLRGDQAFWELEPKIRTEMTKTPDAWWAEHHHGFGTWVRNILRDVYKDDELPTGIWDDYYIPAVEDAINGVHYAR